MMKSPTRTLTIHNIENIETYLNRNPNRKWSAVWKWSSNEYLLHFTEGRNKRKRTITIDREIADGRVHIVVGDERNQTVWEGDYLPQELTKATIETLIGYR